jgi:hypothetical protein
MATLHKSQDKVRQTTMAAAASLRSAYPDTHRKRSLLNVRL